MDLILGVKTEVKGRVWIRVKRDGVVRMEEGKI